MQSEISGPAEEPLLREAMRRIIERNTAYCLIVSDGISERIFYFAIGGIRVIASGPRRTPSIDEDLLERGALDAEQCRQVNEAVDGDDRRFVEAALQMGFCRPDEVQETIVQQVEHELLDLFFWDGAELMLIEGQPPKSFYEGKFQAAALTCNVGALLQGVLERVGVWHRTVSRLPSGRDVYATTDRALQDSAGRHGRLLQFLDGTRTTADAIEKSGIRRVPAFEYVMSAVQQGKLRRASAAEAQRVSREQLLREIELLEESLRDRVEATVVRKRLARTLEHAGENARAAGQWRELGDFERKRNDLDRALECYAECIRLLPTDFATRELVLEIYRHRKDFEQVIAHGRPLAELFLRHNLLNRAKQLLLQLIGLDAEDVSIRRQLVLVLIGLGERDLALKHLRDLARMLEARRAPDGELRDVYVRILALDPRDKNARRRLDEITGVVAQRRVLRITAVAMALLVLALGGAYWIETDARHEVGLAIDEARVMLLTKDIQGARARLETVATEHKLARATRSAHTFLAQIERIQREQAERALRRAKLVQSPVRSPAEAALRDARTEAAAEEMAHDAAKLVGLGQFEDAHRVFKELFTLHGDSRAAHEAKVPLQIRTLPVDARILFNGALAGTGAAVIEYTPAVPCTLEVEREGFESVRSSLDGLQAAELFVPLHRPVRWTASFDAAVDVPPAVANGVIYVVGRDCFLTAVSAADGKQVWRTPLGLYSEATGTPSLVDGVLVVATASGEAVGVTARSGEVVWRRRVGPGVDRPTATVGRAVVAGPTDGSVVALSATDGAVLWKLPEKSLSSGAPVAFAGDRVLWVDARGSLQSVDAKSGRTAERTPLSAVLHGTPLPASDDRIWVFAEDDSLRIVSASSNTAVRRFGTPRANLDAVPAVAGDVAYVAGLDGTITALRADGEVVFRRRIDQAARAGLVVAGGRLYAGGSAGRLTVLDSASGEELWRYDAGGRISALPVVQDGMILVATARGEVIALAE